MKLLLYSPLLLTAYLAMATLQMQEKTFAGYSSSYEVSQTSNEKITTVENTADDFKSNLLFRF